MLRAGLFDGVDAVVSWHPGDRNAVSADSSLANTYTPDERAFADGIRTSFEVAPPPIESASQVMPMEHCVGGASTDTGDVSWRVPTVQMSAATWVPGTSAHSWQAVAAGGTQIGVKGMMVAAKTMALTTIDLLSDPAHVVKAREEFTRARGANFTYTPRLATRKPPLDYRK